MLDLTAKELMTTDVITVHTDTHLNEVVELLSTKKISGVPVVDDSGKLVGVISEADLIDENKRKWAIPRLALYGLWLVPDKLLEDSYSEGCKLLAKDIMTHKVITASEDTLASELAEIMISKRINRVPILRDGKIVGIVTRNDLLRGTCGFPGATCDVEN